MNNVQLGFCSLVVVLLYPRSEFYVPQNVEDKVVQMTQVQPELFGCPLSINHADTEQLMTLPHIGPSRAAQIVAQRKKGRFLRIEDLLKIKGIGEQRLKQIRPYVELNTTDCHPFSQRDPVDARMPNDKKPEELRYLKIDGVTRYR